MEKSVMMLERRHAYSHPAEIESDIIAIDKLIKAIKGSFILDYNGLECINYHIIEDKNFIGTDLITWLYNEKKGTSWVNDIRGCMLSLSTEDEEWTKERNKEYNNVYYRKAIFNTETQSLLIAKLEEYRAEINELALNWEEEIQLEKKAKEERKAKWAIKEEIEFTKPTGGEEGVDGYHDAVYRNSETGTEVRMVQRDVFDVGVYSYPKRLEGTSACLTMGEYNSEEKELHKWIKEFGKFKWFRM